MSYSIEFWSSTEVAAFQSALVRELRANGRHVEERFVVPQTEYWTASSRWRRWLMRFRSYVMYPLRLRRHMARVPANTVSVVCSNTFYAPWVAMRATGQQARVVHWVFDLFPDVLLHSGWLKSGGLGERTLRRIVRQSFDRAAANVFLGKNLLRHAEEKFGEIPRATVIEIGADGAPFRDSEPNAIIDTRNGALLTALYCGNMGRMHDFDTLASALPQVVSLPIHFRLLGNGPGFNTINAKAGSFSNVSFGPNLEASEWVPAMKSAGVALVFLKEVAGGLVMPSKTYSALVAGQAVLAVCPRTSDLAQLILKHDAGWVVEPGDVSGLVETLKHIATDPEGVLKKRRNAWSAGHTHYEQSVIARQWIRLLDDVAATLP